MAKNLTVQALADLLAQPQEGWTMTRGKGWSDGWETWNDSDTSESLWVRFEQAPAAVVLNVMPVKDQWQRESAYRGCVAEGHTLVDGRSFTRRGFDTCSCSLVGPKVEVYEGSHSYRDLAALLVGERARCVTAAEAKKTAVPVPGLTHFSRQPEWFTKAGETLRAGKTVTLSPHGMGTGYTLSRKRSRFAAPASPELEALLGVAGVYLEQYDHD